MDNKVFVKRTLERTPFYMSPVEIIIPFHGEQSRVAKLMESIFNTVLTNRYLVTLVDDCSENKAFAKEISDAKIPGVRYLRHDTHKGFGAAINTALATPGKIKQKQKPKEKPIPWVCIIQSDVQVQDNNWLANLGESLCKLKDGGVKMISPKTNNPVIDNPLLTGPADAKAADRVLEDGYLPMYCVLAHRELFAKVGPLKEFPYAGLEAEEYAKRMKILGYKQAVCGSSWVHHDGGATLQNFARSKKVQEILRKHKDDFYKVGIEVKKEDAEVVHTGEVLITTKEEIS